MRTINVVNQLRSQGHEVSFNVRPDGGIRIYSVDGIKFPKSSSEGNNYARELADKNLSAQQYAQRRESGDVAKMLSKARKSQRLPSISPRKADKTKKRKEKMELKRAMRKLNLLRRSQGKKPFSPITLRQRIRRQGFKETTKTIRNILLKEVGVAYPRAVESFIEYINSLPSKYSSEYLPPLVSAITNALNAVGLQIMDTDLHHLYEEFYEVEKALRDDSSANGLRTQGVFIGLADSMTEEINVSNAKAVSLVDF